MRKQERNKEVKIKGKRERDEKEERKKVNEKEYR